MKSKKRSQEFSCFSHGIQKKGISAIVATVLVILITVAAVTIVWAIIMPMISDNLKEGTACFDADTTLTLEDKGYTCINSTDYVKVQVALGSKDINLVGVQILVSTDGNTVFEINKDVPGINEERVLSTAKNYTGAKTVSIAPIIQVGNTNKTCTPSNEVSLIPCRS